jgi:serine/threonine-protein kinase RsbW
MPQTHSDADRDAGVRRDLRLPATLAAVEMLGAELRRLCTAAGVEDALTADIELAMAEAANNIVIHSLKHATDATFEASIEISPQRVAVELADRGPSFDPAALDRPLPDDDLATGGRGMAIIAALADEVSFRRDGDVNRFRLSKQRV